MKEITDWGLADEVASGRPASVVALVHGRVESHVRLVRALASREDEFASLAAFRRIDLWENPSMIGKLCLRKLPAVILYADGQEFQRWYGPVPVCGVMETLAQVLQSREGA